MQKDFIHFDREKLIITVKFDHKDNLKIGRSDVIISTFSGGPGGQNVNRSMNGIRLIYPIPHTHLRHASRTTQLVTRSMAQRSQTQNLLAAFTQLAHKLHDYFYVPPRRKKTKTPRRAHEKRLRSKKHQSLKKQSRQKENF